MSGEVSEVLPLGARAGEGMDTPLGCGAEGFVGVGAGKRHVRTWDLVS